MTNIFQSIIRNRIRPVRKLLSTAFQHQSSIKLSANIKQLQAFRSAKHIALYHAVNGEISLKSLWQFAEAQGKYCYFPALTQQQTLLFLPATSATPFKNNRYGIPEPDIHHDNAQTPHVLDIIFVPLVAFDNFCHRVGMGGGYYDRTLAGVTRPLLIGVGYEFQRVDFIAPAAWDIPLDAVITEKHTYWRKA